MVITIKRGRDIASYIPFWSWKYLLHILLRFSDDDSCICLCSTQIWSSELCIGQEVGAIRRGRPTSREFGCSRRCHIYLRDCRAFLFVSGTNIIMVFLEFKAMSGLCENLVH